jgi:GT2 family glycosyltransferase
MDDQARSPNGGARVAVVMLTLNQRDTTLRALRSVMPQVGERDRVLVWGNGSTDGTVEAVRQAFPEVLAHHHPENLGVASGRNAGAKMAMSSFDPGYLLFLDNDLVLQPGYLAAMVQTLDTEPTVGQVQSKLLYLDEPNRINDGGGCHINFWLGRTKPVGFRQIDRGQWDQPAPCISATPRSRCARTRCSPARWSPPTSLTRSPRSPASSSARATIASTAATTAA